MPHRGDVVLRRMATIRALTPAALQESAVAVKPVNGNQYAGRMRCSGRGAGRAAAKRDYFKGCLRQGICAQHLKCGFFQLLNIGKCYA